MIRKVLALAAAAALLIIAFVFVPTPEEVASRSGPVPNDGGAANDAAAAAKTEDEIKANGDYPKPEEEGCAGLSDRISTKWGQVFAAQAGDAAKAKVGMEGLTAFCAQFEALDDAALLAKLKTDLNVQP